MGLLVWCSVSGKHKDQIIFAHSFIRCFFAVSLFHPFNVLYLSTYSFEYEKTFKNIIVLYVMLVTAAPMGSNDYHNIPVHNLCSDFP